MSKQTINVGSAPNDNNGESLRSAMQKVNSNFTEFYNAITPSGVKVGIGNPTPVGLLDIVASGSYPALTINQTGSGNALVVEDSSNPDGTPFAINNDGKVIVGSTTAKTIIDRSTASLVPQIQVSGTSGYSNSSIGLMNWSTTGTEESHIVFAKSKNGTAGELGYLATGDKVGTILGIAPNLSNNDWKSVASITFDVDGDRTNNGVPGAISFGTANDSSGSTTEYMRITKTGKVGIGINQPGYNLHVSDESAIANTTIGDGTIKINVNGIGNRTSEIRFASDSTYTTTGGLNIVRQSGATGTSNVVHRGTGALTLTTNEAAAVAMQTTALERMRIAANGDVYIGSTTAINNEKFQVRTSTLGSTYGNRTYSVSLYAPDTANSTCLSFSDYRYTTGLPRSDNSRNLIQRNVDGSDKSYIGIDNLGVSVGYGSTEGIRVTTDGIVAIGLGVDVNNVPNPPASSSILEIQSTQKGVRFPNMTTVQKNNIGGPVAGLVVFDTTLSKLCVYNGSAWQTITSVTPV